MKITVKLQRTGISSSLQRSKGNCGVFLLFFFWTEPDDAFSMEERTFYQVYSLCTASMYYYHSLNLIYGLSFNQAWCKETLYGWNWFEISGVISGELVLISVTLLMEKLLVWKWRAVLWSTAPYIGQAPLPRGVKHVCGDIACISHTQGYTHTRGFKCLATSLARLPTPSQAVQLT